jgi:hypothetical protein
MGDSRTGSRPAAFDARTAPRSAVRKAKRRVAFAIWRQQSDRVFAEQERCERRRFGPTRARTSERSHLSGIADGARSRHAGPRGKRYRASGGSVTGPRGKYRGHTVGAAPVHFPRLRPSLAPAGSAPSGFVYPSRLAFDARRHIADARQDAALDVSRSARFRSERTGLQNFSLPHQHLGSTPQPSRYLTVDGSPVRNGSPDTGPRGIVRASGRDLPPRPGIGVSSFPGSRGSVTGPRGVMLPGLGGSYTGPRGVVLPGFGGSFRGI